MKKVTLLFALLIFSMALLISQNVSEYTFSTITTGSLEDMSSGTTPILGPGSYYDDTATAVVDFGFTFTFAGTGYNQFSANSNGQMRLGGTVISTFPNFGANVAYLYPFSGDNALMATGQIHYKVVGSAPNRKLVVEWLGFRIPYGSTGIGSQMQVWLHETTNRVDYVYGNMYANSSTSRGICIANSNVEGSIGNITNIITTPTWTPTGTSVVNTSISLGDIPNLNSTANGSRRVFTWEPPVAVAAPNPALCISPINGATDVWINPSLNWSSGGGLPNGYKVFFGTSIPGTPNATQAATTWNTGMLQYSTTYYWQIIPYNDFGDAADCPVWSFTTMNDPTITAFPYVQNFDAVTAPALPLGWTALDNNGDADIWQTYASNPHSAPNAAMIYTDYNSTNDDYLITPPVVLTGNQRMKFWTRCQSTGEPDEVAVLLSSTTPSAEAFTLVALASTPVNYTTYAEITVDLSAYSGTHYIAFARRGDPADGWRLYVDDVRIEDIPTAPIISVSPTAWDFGQTVIGTVQTKQFTVGNIGSGTLTLSNISVSGSYFSVSVNPAPVSLGPDESTTFTVQYAPLVAGTHEGTVTITDNRAITTIDLDGTCFDPTITAIPYTQTFEVWPPAGWDLTGGTYSFAQYTAAGNNWARANYWGQPGGNTDIMTTPPINPGEATRIQFTWSHLYNSSYPNDALTVQVSSDYVNWTDIWSRSGSTLNSNDGAGSTTPGTGVTEVLTIPVQFQSGAYFVRFYGYSGYGPDLFIDNFVVEAIPQAPIFEYAPTSLPFGGVAENASSGWQNVTVMNTGGGTLNLVAGNLSLTGTNADQFAFNPANLPAALANGQSVAIPVQFNPTSQGEKTATLRIDYSGTYYDVALSGTGMPEGLVVIGTGTNIGPVPSYPWYTYTYSQSIYLQGEINTPNRRIESLWWYWNGNSTITEPNMDIYMGHTTLSEFSGSFVPIADHTLVFSGPFTVPASAGWVEFPLITPFMYNNTDNLIITANENGGPSSTYYSQSDGFYITPAATLRSIYSVNDSAPYVPANMTTGTTYSFYPNVMLILGEVPVGTPGHVTLNTPANGATMIDPDNTTLTWAPDGATAPPAYYQIFVGSEPIDPANEYYGEYYYEANGRVAFNLSEEEDIELTYNSRWYWAVLPVGGDDSTPDPQDENFMVWNFRIQPPPPQISVNPMSLTSMVDFGETDVQNITISNTGGLPLDYSIALVEDAMRGSQIVPIDQYVSNPHPMRSGSSENAPYMLQNLPESVRALFDLQFAYDTYSTAGEYGIATDGQYIYVSLWSGTGIYKYSLSGTYIETLTVTDYPGAIRDLTYDGTYFYGAANSTTIYQLDLTNNVMVGTITSPVATRAIAYDPDQDAFWVGNNWTADLRLVNRSGVQIGALTPATASIAGMAYDNVSGPTPTLWLNTQTGTALSPNQWHQIDITTGAILQSYDMVASSIAPVDDEASAGGAFISTDLVPGFATLVGMMQNYQFYGLELCTTASWAVPNPRTGTIPAGESAQIQVTFDGINTPPGGYNGNLVITNNAGAPVNVDLTFTVEGEWLPVFQIAPETWNYNEVELLNPSTKQFIITNTGGGSLTIGEGGIYLSDNAEGNFILDAPGLPVTLAHNETYTLSVGFTPVTTGAKTATLNIVDNLRVTNTVALQGTGVEEPIGQVVGLTATPVANEDIQLNWSTVYGFDGEPGWVHYDDGSNVDGIGTGAAATFNVAAKYVTDLLAPYTGMQLTKINFFPLSANTNYTMRVWTGSNGSLAPTTMVHEQAVTPVVGQWNEVTLTTPIPITGTEAIWFGYYCDVLAVDPLNYHPAGCDAGPAVPGLSDLIELGGTWYSMNNQYGLNYNWNLQAFIENIPALSSRGKLLNIAVDSMPVRSVNLRDIRLGTLSGNTTQRVLRGFNVYRDNVMINNGLVAASNYLDVNPGVGTYSYTVQGVYYSANTPMSNPALATIIPPVPMELPLTEDWASGDFATNQWTTGSTNWVINATTGQPAPSASFSWSPQVTDYSIPLTSYILNGAGLNSITLNYDLALNNYSLVAENKMTVQVWDGTTWQTVADHTSLDYADTGINVWGSYSVDISAHASNRIFKVRFLANGEDSYEINYWYLDNILIQEAVLALDPPQNVVSSSLSATSVLLQWDTVAGATWYAVYAATDPYGEYTLIGTTTETSAVITLIGNLEFYKVTAGSGDQPRFQGRINQTRRSK